MSANPLFISAIVLAGGKGLRLKTQTPKQYLPLKGKPIVLYSYELFQSSPSINEIIVVCDPAYQHYFSGANKPVHFAKPGERRQDSVLEGLKHVSPKTNLVCIHDGARPLLSKEELQAVLADAALYKAAALAVPAKNTIKQVDEKGFVTKTLDRSVLWEMHTPQVIEISLLRDGFAKAAQQNNLTVTDDVALVELLGYPVKLVKGSYHNIKITTQEDLRLAETLMESSSV